MTRVTYGLEIFDTHDRRIDLHSEIVSVEYARAVNNIGTSIVRLPLTPDVLPVGNNYKLKIYRVGPYGTITLAGKTHWYINRVTYLEDESLIEIGAVCPNALLKKRVVAYTGQTTYADKTREEFLIDNYDPLPAFCIDNMMRQYVRENMGSAALDPLRDLSPYIDIEPDSCLGPQGEKQAGFAYLLSTLQDLTNMSQEQGTPLYFELSPHGSSLLFRVSAWYLNENHGSNTLLPVIFQAELGQLSSVNLSFDWTEEGNVVYVQGEDNGAAKLYETVVDPLRSTDGVFARSEFVHDAGSEAGNVAYLQMQGRAALSAHRPRVRLTANIVDDMGLVYGEDFGYGDGVVAAYRGYQFNCIVRAEHVTYREGEEILDIALEGEMFFGRELAGGGGDGGGSGQVPYPASTPPVITVLGTNPITVDFGSVYVDAGATALDAEDGDITASIIVGGDTVDTGVPGTYVITYDVTDSGGAAAIQKTRTVIVDSAWVVPLPGDPTVWYGSPGAYILWDAAHVMRTWNILAASPVWELVDTGITGTVQDGQYIHVDADTVGMWLLTSDGVWWCADIMATTPAWTLKLATTTVQAGDAAIATGSIIIKAMMAYASEPGYLIVASGPDSITSAESYDYAHSYTWHTHDFGANWIQVDMLAFTETRLGHTAGYCGCGRYGIDIYKSSPVIWIVRSTPNLQDLTAVFKSLDLGTTWSKEYSIADFSSDVASGPGLLAQFPTFTDRAYLNRGNVLSGSWGWMYTSDDAWATATQQTKPAGYSGTDHQLRPNSHTFDPNHCIAVWRKTDGSAYVQESYDGAATWTELWNTGGVATTVNTPNGWPPDANLWFTVFKNKTLGGTGVIMYTGNNFVATSSKEGNLAALIGSWTTGDCNGFALPKVAPNV